MIRRFLDARARAAGKPLVEYIHGLVDAALLGLWIGLVLTQLVRGLS